MASDIPLTVNQMMAAMKALGGLRCHLDFSEYIGKWYLSCGIDISNEEIRSSVTEHRDDPIEAVKAYWRRITTIAPWEHLVMYRGDGKPDWRGRWNGYMWEERS